MDLQYYIIDKMDIDELIKKWVEPFNKNYNGYIFNEKEPRYNLKQFFLYSYCLFRRFGKEWDSYSEKYSELFCRNPSLDYYGCRNPCETNEKEARRNTLEWVVIFEVIRRIGYPYNRSAKENLIKNAEKYLSFAMKNPSDLLHDIMLSSAIENLPDKYEMVEEWYLDWIPNQIRENNLSIHQLTAYFNALNKITDTNEIQEYQEYIEGRIISWIDSPKENPERQILMWARIATRLKCVDNFTSDIKEKIKTNFFNNLKNIHDIEWSNRPIVLEAAYILGDSKIKKYIKSEISRQITPSRFYRFKEIFWFLDENSELNELNDEVLRIKEKCRKNPTKELCLKCMDEPQGECWIRILAKLKGVAPWTHGPFEVADVVVYTLDKGIYFVIKANRIDHQRGEGDILYRQCTKLFSNDHALVLYWNPYDTHPMVIQNIRNIADCMETNPRFEIVDKKYIRQVYKKYKEQKSNNKLKK